MYTFLLEKQGASTYLVYKLSAQDRIDDTTMGMLSNNDIRGVAPVVCMQIDGEISLKYNISGRVSLQTLFSREANKDRIITVFKNIAATLIACDDYMISETQFVFLPQFVFAQESSGDVALICMPLEGFSGSKTGLRDFFKKIVSNLRIPAYEDGSFLTQIISYLNGEQVFSAKEFHAFLLRLQNEDRWSVGGEPNRAPESRPQPQYPDAVPPQGMPGMAGEDVLPHTVLQDVSQQRPDMSMDIRRPQPPFMPQPAPTAVAGYQPPEPPQKKISFFYLLTHPSKENRARYKNQKNQKGATMPSAQPIPQSFTPAGGYANPGQTLYEPITGTGRSTGSGYGAIQPTEFGQLPDGPSLKNIQFDERAADFGHTQILFEQTDYPKIVRLKTGEKRDIDVDVLRIGKNKDSVDFCIAGNDVISRHHADILTENGRLYIVDCNSMNHTYVDGRKVLPSQKIEITSMSTIRLANEDFKIEM